MNDPIATLIAARHAAHMTQKDLSRAAGIHQVSLATIETRRSSPRLTTLEKIAKTLNLSIFLLPTPPSEPSAPSESEASSPPPDGRASE